MGIGLLVTGLTSAWMCCCHEATSSSPSRLQWRWWCGWQPIGGPVATGIRGCSSSVPDSSPSPSSVPEPCTEEPSGTVATSFSGECSESPVNYLDMLAALRVRCILSPRRWPKVETMNKLRYTNCIEAGSSRALAATHAASTRIRPVGVAGMATPATPGAFRIGTPDLLDLNRRPRIE